MLCCQRSKLVIAFAKDESDRKRWLIARVRDAEFLHLQTLWATLAVASSFWNSDANFLSLCSRFEKCTWISCGCPLIKWCIFVAEIILMAVEPFLSRMVWGRYRLHFDGCIFRLDFNAHISCIIGRWSWSVSSRLAAIKPSSFVANTTRQSASAHGIIERSQENARVMPSLVPRYRITNSLPL